MAHEKNKTQIYHHIIYGIFLILFLLEPLAKIFNDPISNHRVKAVVKVTLLFILLCGTLLFKIKKEVLLYSLTLIFFFLIGQYTLVEEYSVFGDNLIEEIKRGDIYIVIKYLYIIIFVAVYEKIIGNKTLTERLVNLFNGFMIINTIFIMIGIITNWELFKSYPNTTRFGYHGLIELVGESIHLYCIAIALAYVNYLKNKKVTMLLLFILGGILLGKKAIFLYLFLLTFLHLIYHKNIKILYGLSGLTVLFLVFHKLIIEALLKVFPFWQNLYYEKGLLTVILSKRDILFEQSINYIQTHWCPLNYFFGGIDFNNYRSEFGFFDLFLAFGLLGFILYLWFIYKYFFIKQRILVKTIFLAIFIIEVFSGGLIINVIPMIFLYLVAKYMEENYTTTNNEKFKNIPNSHCAPR